MRIKLLFLTLFFTALSSGQSIFTNPITGTNPSNANPFTSGQTVDPNITVSGIGIGTGINSNTGNDRYNATSWSTNSSIKTSDYFEFTLTPNSGYKIDFTEFIYTSQVSPTGPTLFAFRSSIDGYSANIGTPTVGGTTISLSSASYQSITTPITFRIYGWKSVGSAGTFSIDDFTFNGSVNCAMNPTTTGVTICQGGAGSLMYSTICPSGSSVTAGPNNAGTGESGAGASSAWIDPDFVKKNDNTFATSSINKNKSSNALNATTFNFAIPTNATISGVQVTIGRYASKKNSLYDESVQLIVGGAVVGTNNGATATNWPTTELPANYGSATDLWGNTLTAALINDAANFGVALVVKNNSSGGETASVDYVQVTVTYTVPGTLNWYTVSSGGTSIGSGSPFNPVGVAGSGLTDTNTPGTYTFYAECSSNPGCRTATNFVINAVPLAPAIGTIIQPDCVTATGTMVLNGLPATGTWNLYQNGNVTPIVNGGTGTTYTVSGLAVGNYTFTVSNGNCTSVASSSVGMIAPVTTTWNATNGVGSWTNGPPTIAKALTFSGNYNSSTDTIDTVVEGCSCKVNSGAAVVFTSGKTLKISNEVKIVGSGTLTFENNASLVQINEPATNNNPNSGNIIYNRLTSTARSSDYSYWSSPVADQTLSVVFPNSPSGFFYSYNAFANPEDWKQEAPTTTIMKIGTGYILQGPQTNAPPSFYNVPFFGVPNNGLINTPIGPTGTSNLLGNPYPSAIDADQFLTFNSGVIDGTLYFWTHNTAIQLASQITNAGSGAYAYTSNDYASYNLTGGVGIDGVSYVKGGTIAPSGNTTKPTGKIAAGQAFFATSIANGSNVLFNNSMRLSALGAILDNSRFFKSVNAKEKTTNTIEKHRIWLDLTNSQGAFKQTLIGYITGGTNEFDSSFDGESFDGNEFVDFYSVNQDKNLVIQGRALPFQDADEVPLGYRTTIDGVFTINIDQADGLLTDQAVFIEDKLTNTVFDLKKGDYTFTTVAGTFNDRFILSYTNKSLGTNDFNTKGNQVLVSNKNKQLKINSPMETIDKVLVYDIAGKQIFQRTNVNSNELLIPNLVSSHQVLLVKTTLQNGHAVNNKIIY